MKVTKEQENRLKDIIVRMIGVNIANMQFQKSLSMVKEHKKTFNKLIKHSYKAQEYVMKINHVDILFNIYNSFIHGHETFYIALTESVYKNVKRWDTTKVGYKEFKRLEQEAIELTDKEMKEKKELAETIKKAKAEGKKIEYLYEGGKIRPVIVEEKKN